jgi:hypothetical protein
MNLAPLASYATVFGVQAKLAEGRWRAADRRRGERNGQLTPRA